MLPLLFHNVTKFEPTLWKFTAKLEIIGINPYVYVPEKILTAVKAQAGQDKGPIPIEVR